jgi:hypothetical protein
VGTNDNTEGPATSSERIAAWNKTLLAEILPLQAERGTPVLLACDAEAIRAAGARLGWAGDDAEREFCSDVKVAFSIGQIAGFKKAIGGEFENASRPRPVPTVFACLCLWVLAASRMAPDEKHATHAYHHHLRQLLELPGDGALPQFEYIKLGFEQLADWLDDDLAGARGHLIVPDDPHPAWVGYAIAQTVFRARDRQILSIFFSERLRGGLDGVDPLPLLRRWSGRHQLTRHALALVDDTSVAQRVRAAVRGAYASWDGAELVELESGGKLGRAFPARLHLLPHPPRLHLSANVTAPATLALDGSEQTLEPGGEIALPWAMLAALSERQHLVGDPTAASGAVRIPALGPTLLFEASEDGLLHVAEPIEETVWILTRDHDLVRRLESKRFRDHGVLPDGWRLLRDVAVSSLPGVERALAPTAERLPFTLEAGLPLERSVYLSGHPPILAAGELELGDERLPVFVDGAQVGTIASGERLALGTLGHGAHELVVGDGEYKARFHLDRRGTHEGYGMLVNRLDGERVLRAGGARPNPGQGLRICGAALSQPYRGALPVLTRSPVALASLDRAGELAWHPHSPTPAWFAEAGIENGRWEILREGLIWLLSPEPRTGKPWARLEQEAQLEQLSSEAVAIVRAMNAGDIAVSSRRHAAVAVDRWLELVEIAEGGA